MIKLFYGQYWQNFKGKQLTLIELMILHRTSMQMIDYMHDFFCKGNKDYKQALSNVQDYNAAKILSNKAAIPSKDG